MQEKLVKGFEGELINLFEYNNDLEQIKYLLNSVLLPFWRKHIAWTNSIIRVKNIVERSSIGSFKPTVRDASILFAVILAKEEYFAYFREFLDEEVRNVLDALVWDPKMSDDDIEEELQISICVTENKGYYYGNRKHLIEKFQIFPYQVDNHWQTLSSNYYLFFPHDIRIHLMEYYEKPQGFDMVEVEELEQGLHLFEDNGQILSEIPLIDIYHKQDKIKIGKSGKPHANTYAGMRKKLGLREFYPQKDAHKILQNIRTAMLANLWTTMSPKRRSKDSGLNLLKNLFDNYYFRNKFNHHFLLLHLNGLTNVDDYGVTPFEQIFRILQEALLLNKWVDIDNIQAWLHYRGYRIAAVDIDHAKHYLSYTSTYSPHASSSYISGANFDEIVTEPSLKAYFFLYGAYGLFDLAYETPNTKKPGKTCSSPFDGLRYVRLNSLGAYILGITSNYEVVNNIEEGVYELSATNLIIRVSETSSPDKSDRLVNFASSLGNRRYKVSHESFLKNCQHKEDIEAQIVLFRQLVNDSPPKIWEDFFKDVLNRANPLELVEAVKVFKLPENPELLRLIAQDVKLQGIIAKAENYQIIIKKKDMPLLKSRLKVFGYLV